MKILITTDWYYPAINGVVTSVLNLKKELIKEGNVIDVYLLYNLGFENWEKVIKHDDLAFIDKMVQIQLKVLDEFHQVGVEGLKSVDINQTKYAEVM